jgi:hypothetical protein
MSAPLPSLPTGPLPHPAMDYAALRAEGLDLLGRLTGTQWTDYNTHDPGITLLEQLCYAITDLGYRCNLPMADLLAPAADTGLPGPTAILPGDPVTLEDLRRRVLDIAGTEQAWVGAPLRRALDFYFHEGSGQLRLRPDPSEPAAQPVEMRGLLAVAAQGDDDFAGDAALDALSQRLHASRPLGADFEIGWLATTAVALIATIEVGATDDPTATLADIVECVQDCLAPPARFLPLAAAGTPRLDALFEGPLLERGIAPQLPESPTAVFASDLIHAITNVAAVRAVRSIAPQVVNIDQGRVALLGKDSRIVLLRAGLPLRASLDDAFALVAQRRRERRSQRLDLSALAPPPGRDRQLARYRSVQRQLPAAYGVGPLGLAASETAQRRAQARQLQAYLLLFDQLLANQFAQLANAHALLSPDPGGTRSYFTQAVDDPPLDLASLLPPAADDALADAAAAAAELDRRKRFLAHLLARFAEQIGDHAQVQAADAQALVASRQDFLAQMARLSGGRGSGADLRTGSASAFAERLRLKLCLPGLRFHVVEHVLLRPVAEDVQQLDDDGGASVPLLDGVTEADPWSLRLSVVLHQPTADSVEAGWQDGAERYVAQMLLAEVPAHLSTRVHWLDDAGDTCWSAFDAAWADFQGVLTTYRWAAVGADPALAALRFRDARDRVVELLGLGRCMPLRDVPWTQHLVVPAGSRAEVRLATSQRGVDYALFDAGGAAVQSDGKPLKAAGTGGPLVLLTPPVTVDVTWRMLATRRWPAELAPRSAWLHGSVRIEDGVDPARVAEMPELPPLDPGIDAPQPADARITDFATAVNVVVRSSQEGVSYQLVDHADPARTLSAIVTGTSGDITLVLALAIEDIDLRVHAWRKVGPPGHEELREAWLDTVLALRVRANRTPGAALAQAVVDCGGAAAVVLQSTQASASYRVWQRKPRDGEYWFAVDGDAETVVSAGETRPVSVRRPPHQHPWAVPEMFMPAGAAAPGKTGALSLDIGRFSNDAMLLVQAEKQHRTKPADRDDGQRIASAVQLNAALLLLVRPDPAVALRLRVALTAASATSTWDVQGGQPGVLYELQVAGAAIGLPGYMHQRDDADALQNQGLGQLRVEIDLALARDPPPPNNPAASPATTAPLPPRIRAAVLPAGTEIQVLARHAISGVSAPLARRALLSAPPVVSAPAVAAGQVATLTITASLAGEFYTVLLDDSVVAGPVAGTGAALSLPLVAIGRRTEFELRAEMRDPARLSLERSIRVAIDVS